MKNSTTICLAVLAAMTLALTASTHAATYVLIDGTDNVGVTTDGDGYTLNGSFESVTASKPDFWEAAQGGSLGNANVIGSTTNPGTDPETNGTTQIIGSGDGGGFPAGANSAAINTHQADGENFGNYLVSLGDTYSLSFEHAGAFGWNANDDIDWRLYYTSDDTSTGTATTLFSGTVDTQPRTGSSPNFNMDWQTLSVTTAAVTDAGAAGKQLWFSITPDLTDDATDGDFARVDEVNLTVNNKVAFVSPPANVQGDADVLTSDTDIFMFEEKTVTLGSALTVDQDNIKGQTYGPNASVDQGSLAAGTEVTSYYVHFDPINASTSDTVTWTFDREVIAILYSTANLDATDGLLGLDGVLYPTDGGTTNFRGAINEGTDNITISADGRTVTIQLFAGAGASTDQFRILVLVPAPAALPAGLMLLTACAMRRRRRA